MFDFLKWIFTKQDHLIPKGTIVPVRLIIIPGGHGPAGLLNSPRQASYSPFLNTQLEIISGPYRGRRLYKKFPVKKGIPTEKDMNDKQWELNRLYADIVDEPIDSVSILERLQELEGITFNVEVGIKKLPSRKFINCVKRILLHDESFYSDKPPVVHPPLPEKMYRLNPITKAYRYILWRFKSRFKTAHKDERIDDESVPEGLVAKAKIRIIPGNQGENGLLSKKKDYEALYVHFGFTIASGRYKGTELETYYPVSHTEIVSTHSMPEVHVRLGIRKLALVLAEVTHKPVPPNLVLCRVSEFEGLECYIYNKKAPVFRGTENGFPTDVQIVTQEDPVHPFHGSEGHSWVRKFCALFC